MLRRAAHRQAETDAKFVRFKAEVIAREARTLAHAVAETAVLRAQLAEAQAASQALAEVHGVVEADKNGSFSIKTGRPRIPSTSRSSASCARLRRRLFQPRHRSASQPQQSGRAGAPSSAWVPCAPPRRPLTVANAHEDSGPYRLHRHRLHHPM
ncbi:hypothetical protein ACKKBF_B20255 [Auxenochlorella protothecoides x Auxenochlorella symbiontica]